MKCIIDFIKKTFYNTAAIYLLVSGILFVTFFAASDMDSATSGAVNLQLYSMLFSFLCSLVLSVTGIIPKMPSAVKTICDFVLSYAAFYLCFFGLTGNSKNFTSLFALSTVYIVFFVLCSLLCAVGRRLSADRNDGEYENVYTEEK
jgi:hypothetical protein